MCTLSFIVSALGFSTSTPEDVRFVVAGYAPEYRLDGLNLPVIGANLSHVLLFSISPLPNGSLATDRLSISHLMQVGRAKKAHPHLRVLVSIGGGGRSEHFKEMTQDAKARGRFAKALAGYCTRRKLDGADFDWEAPTNSAEADAYTKLLSRVKTEFGKRTPALQLTLAVHPGGHVQLMRQAVEHVDLVNLMAYDMIEGDHRKRHSTEAAAEESIALALSEGYPRQKLVLGIPMYGRDIHNIGYAETYRELRPKRRVEDEEDFSGSVYFNGPATVRRKTTFAVREGLAGASHHPPAYSPISYVFHNGA